MDKDVRICNGDYHDIHNNHQNYGIHSINNNTHNSHNSKNYVIITENSGKNHPHCAISLMTTF